jgi:hypothetical protein
MLGLDLILVDFYVLLEDNIDIPQVISVLRRHLTTILIYPIVVKLSKIYYQSTDRTSLSTMFGKSHLCCCQLSEELYL